MAAFVNGTLLKISSNGVSENMCGVSADRSAVVMMACRRNLKYEKRLRNSEYARAHRKKVVRVNRRAESQEKVDSDASYLGEIFNTLNFGASEEDEKSDNRDNRDNRRGGNRKREDRN